MSDKRRGDLWLNALESKAGEATGPLCGYEITTRVLVQDAGDLAVVHELLDYCRGYGVAEVTKIALLHWKDTDTDPS